MLRELARERPFALEGLADAPALRDRDAHGAQRDFQAGGAALAEGVEGVGRPFGHVAALFVVQGGDDGFEGVVGEAAVDGAAEGPGQEDGFVVGEAGVEFFDGGVDGGEAGGEVVVVFEGEFGQAGRQRAEAGAVDVVGRDAGVEGVDALEAGGRQGEVGSGGAVEAREEETAADVWEEADGGFGHGEEGAFGGDADGGVHGEADAAAHGYAVHVGDVRLGVGGDQVVQAVFEREVVFGLLDAGLPFSGYLLGESGDVAAGTEGLFAGAGDDYYIG